jgi:hypothetical protein
MNEEYSEAAQAFYEWEEVKYSGTSPLSDDDKHIWIQGYVYAIDLFKWQKKLENVNDLSRWMDQLRYVSRL